MTRTATPETATAYQYLRTLGLFHARDASFVHEGELVHIVAHHQRDTSTAKYFEGADPEAMLVSVRTITNNIRGKGRKLADDQRKVMLMPEIELGLVPTC